MNGTSCIWLPVNFYREKGEEMLSQKDTYKLSNGVGIPCVGFGTWQTPNGETAV